MGRTHCCDKTKVKRGPWSPEEDQILRKYLLNHGTGGNWITLPQKAGLKRCGKSCRLRWLNYLRPDLKHGGFTPEEDALIYTLYSRLGSRWSIIASQLPGRTDNDVKNHWNSKLKKKILPGEAFTIDINYRQRTTSKNIVLVDNGNAYNNNATAAASANAPFTLTNIATAQAFLPLESKPEPELSYNPNPIFSAIVGETWTPPTTAAAFFAADHCSVGTDGSNFSSDSRAIYASSSLSQPQEDSSISDQSASLGMPWNYNHCQNQGSMGGQLHHHPIMQMSSSSNHNNTAYDSYEMMSGFWPQETTNVLEGLHNPYFACQFIN